MRRGPCARDTGRRWIGSILTLPIFVFVAGISAKEAIPMSVSSARACSERLCITVAATLIPKRLCSSAYAAWWELTSAPFLFSERVLLAIFAVLMLIVGVACFVRKAPPRILKQMLSGALRSYRRFGRRLGWLCRCGRWFYDCSSSGTVRRDSGRTGRGNLSRDHRSQRGFRFCGTDSKDLHSLIADIWLSWTGDPRNARRNDGG